MFRYLLASYLLLLAVTGATPCCCTVARASQVVASMVEIQAGEHPAVPSCCHSSVKECSETTGPEGTSDNSVPKKCQCEKASCEAVVPEQTVIAVDSLSHFLLDTFGLLASPMTVDVMADGFMLSSAGGIEPSGLSGRDVRVAYCSWRC